MAEHQHSGGILLTVLAVAGLGIAYALRKSDSEYEEFLTSDLVNPSAVADVAASLDNATEDSFILNAWEEVGAGIPYERFGSDMLFVNSHVRCARCLLPVETLGRGRANCVGKSGVLASILRNRLPADRVYMVIGDYEAPGADDNDKGHAWVEVFRAGHWYLVEATKPPPTSPWVRVQDKAYLYSPKVYLNDVYFDCHSPSLCVVVPSSCRVLTEPCPCV